MYRQRPPFWYVLTLLSVFLLWHKVRKEYPSVAGTHGILESREVVQNYMFSVGDSQLELDKGGVTLLYQLMRLRLSPHNRGANPNLQKVTILYLALALLGEAWDIELNPGPYVYKGKYPCQVCNKAVKFKQQAIRCDACNTWWHKDCMNMSDSVYDDFYLVDQALTWECKNCF